nr:o-succinylbenzoate synthase [Myxosarcina sp. GI1]
MKAANKIYKFQFDTYQRRFRQPLQTSKGTWRVREGIIVSLTDESGKSGRGEIAPLPDFGSETLAQGLEFCQRFDSTITTAKIYQIGDCLPACQFAFESALLNLREKENSDSGIDLDYCYLLPAGTKALTAWQELERPYPSTFKWKIDVLSIAEEIAIFQKLVAALPPKSKLRLDANAGLDSQQTRQWLQVAEASNKVEFIEQPLSPNDFAEMLSLSKEYSTAIALDESVASFNQLETAYKRGWQGVYVIKAAIMGYPSRLLDFCQDKAIDVVFSSVFETEIGRQAVLNLAAKLPNRRAVGFGVNHWF